MIGFGLPADQRVLVAIGKVSIRHGQLDYSLKMVIRALTSTTLDEALLATDGVGSSDLREQVRQLAKKRLKEGRPLILMRAFLTRAKDITARRNELLHSLWVHELDGRPVIRSRGTEFRASPSSEDLESLADQFDELSKDINHARLDGFLKEALEACPAF